MSENALNDPGIMAAITATDARRFIQLRRAFLKQRANKTKPTIGEVALLERAVSLTLIAERARSNPRVPIEQIVRADHCAQRARLQWQRMARSGDPARHDGVPSLSSLMGAQP